MSLLAHFFFKVREARMGGIARVGDKDSRGNTIVSGSSNVFINGRAVARVGDKDSRGDTLVQGSSTVFVNGLPVHRAGDLDSRGDRQVEGSTDCNCG